MTGLPKQRGNHLSVVEHFSLDDACSVVNAAFRDRGYGVYQVGSSLVRENYRDVDLRCVLDDEDFNAMFRADNSLALRFLNAAISEWIAKRTGMNIDFQFQSQTDANTHEGPRSAIGGMLSRDGG